MVFSLLNYLAVLEQAILERRWFFAFIIVQCRNFPFIDLYINFSPNERYVFLALATIASLLTAFHHIHYLKCLFISGSHSNT